ncbi:ADP-ribose pyrophosphatase [Actinomadura hallensis]|uniref:ADP-ribose pyrophosphatase n=1 Tax=Actinomadura hallensis TaxID=337895 RepID=A0A543IDB5_9ACTN|nr:NUDIX hydrolase [Actinomadura hallensis]TQM68575.1 ADP-ribose pyrophosphatase [Actinomadura hallensis]HLV74715.1 NUDIX hydrolase [Vulgatibacteraceae bacterium]
MTGPDDAYERLRRDRPDLFENPPGAWTTIVDGYPSEGGPYGVCYRDPYVTLLRDPVEFPDGRTGGYVRAVHSGGHAGAAILAVFEGKVVLLRHFRHATRTWHWEIPRGFSQPGETPEQTARRELEEEIGAPARAVEFLGDFHADTGVAGSRAALFWAEVARPRASHPEEGVERIEPVPPRRLGRMLDDGEITDSFTLGALLFAQRRGLAPFAS